MPIFLHVGCGQKRKSQTTRGLASAEWSELRLDIDAAVDPDVIGSMTDMRAVANESVDAIYSSHNIEHLYPHEVPQALAEFRRVLKPEGFAIVTCPDLQAVAELVAQDKLTHPAYQSPAGPIAPLDILYGHRPALAHGNLYMAHRTGFTMSSLMKEFSASGFGSCIGRRQPPPAYALWAVATREPTQETHLRRLAAEHFPS
ncbi:MAG: class I SAM-dependent methyltransferase [Comamonadaceae bacterium]|nr:MAG: class I SAM-dependent methyltransferase [Comamonadaceae bacterium]